MHAPKLEYLVKTTLLFLSIYYVFVDMICLETSRVPCAMAFYFTEYAHPSCGHAHGARGNRLLDDCLNSTTRTISHENVLKSADNDCVNI